jgi:hypothetical protein
MTPEYWEITSIMLLIDLKAKCDEKNGDGWPPKTLAPAVLGMMANYFAERMPRVPLRWPSPLMTNMDLSKCIFDVLVFIWEERPDLIKRNDDGSFFYAGPPPKL